MHIDMQLYTIDNIKTILVLRKSDSILIFVFTNHILKKLSIRSPR
jgi:hypothetical protein